MICLDQLVFINNHMILCENYASCLDIHNGGEGEWAKVKLYIAWMIELLDF